MSAGCKMCEKCGELKPILSFAHRYKLAHGSKICDPCRISGNFALVVCKASFLRKRLSMDMDKWVIIGCNAAAFKTHIERQFLKGMNWGNRNEWHIDHITPIATATNKGDVIALNHFTNLRPMWAKDNISKGAQITHLI